RPLPRQWTGQPTMTNKPRAHVSDETIPRRPRQVTAEFAVTVIKDARVTVLRLTGEGRFTAVDRLRSTFAGLIARRVRLVVLDLSGLTSLTTLPMGVMVLFSRYVRRFGGRVKVAGVRPQVDAAREAVRPHRFFRAW